MVPALVWHGQRKQRARDSRPLVWDHFYVPDVDATYDEFRGRGIAVKEPPNESLSGMRDMTVVDPDGNQLRFITRLDKGTA